MASYQVRQRERLFDSKTQAVLERRSKELLGAALLVVGVLTAMLLMSYVPDDPSWLSATDAPAQNWLGRFGASIASPLFVIVGYGAWGFPLVFLTWGLRFILHIGSDRGLARGIFAPIAVALASVYASTHVPMPDWTHAFGLGGLFGDTILGAVLGVVPVSATFGLKVLAFFVAIAAVGMALFVLGFTGRELQAVLRFMIVGFVLAYASVMSGIGRVVGGVAGGAAAMRRRAADRAERKRAHDAEAAAEAQALAGEMEIAPQMSRAPMVARRAAAAPPKPQTAPDIPAPAAAEPKSGLRIRLPGLKKRAADPDLTPELVERTPPDMAEDLPYGETSERIKAKIDGAIRNRVIQKPVMQLNRSEPPVARSRGRGVPPAPFQAVDTPEEPPLTAAQAAAQARLAMDPQMPPGPAPLPEPPLTAAPLTAAKPAGIPPAPPMPQAAPMPHAVVQHPPKKPVQPSRQAQAEAQPQLQFDESAVQYETPPLSLLASPSEVVRHVLSDEALAENARMLENVLDDYGVKGDIVSVRPGPVVTMYELEPAPGLKASRVIGLADDIARSMSALSARVSTVPGRSVIGIELPNANREKVVLREILSARDFGDANMRLPLALGKDIGGESVVANLAKMPHLLIAGTTGSGKSVAINTMILSLLYRLTPDQCRMIMIDPKMLELSVYDGIPHLLSPVVTDPKKAVVALKWVVGEMEERYRKMSKMGVRNIEGYNGRVQDALAKGETFSRTVQTGFDDDTGDPVFETEEITPEAMPYIVVIVDEMADLMMVAGKEIEACIQRLAQMARASGIHLIMATQRPSVDVITGTIKANFPTRISFQVTSKIDSRTILGEMGAEQLLGMGDMLYMAGGSRITRVHGPFVSDEEVEEIVNHLKAFGPPSYIGGVVEGPPEDSSSEIDAVLGLGGNTDGEDALYDQAVAVVIKDRKCSTSYIQRKLAIGYNKAARLVEQMEEEGLVSASNHVGKREILVPEQQ